MPELIENKVSHVTQTEEKDVCAEVSHVTQTEEKEPGAEKVSHVTLSPLETLAAIEQGVRPASLDEINGAIGFQISMAEKASSSIAFCIALVRRDFLTDKRQWKEWAVRTCKFTNLSHMHKLKKIGFVMISGELSRTNFRKFFLLDTDKQAALAVMPPVKVNDFLDLHPDLAKESREKIRTMVAAFFPHAKQTGDDEEDGENEQPEQLSFTFDLFSGDEGVEKIYDITRSDRLDVCSALALTQNGTTICRAVTDWIAKHPEDFDDEGDLAYLEEKYREMQEASNKMLAVITEKKRKQLQLT